MYKLALWMSIGLFALFLGACSAVQAATGGAAPGQGTEPGAARELPQSTRLILATYKLDETQHPISAEQAKTMLPLWKALRALTGSDTAAPQEVQAVLTQIEAGLTPEQAADVKAMNLSFQDLRALSEKFGLGGGFGGQNPEMQATMQAARQSGGGGMPGGGFPGGGPGGPGGPPPGEGGGVSREARQTAQARNGGGGTRLNPALIEAVIKFLQARAQ